MQSGADLIVDILRDEGVTHVFGNPGSTELVLIDAITRSPDLTYVLGLHEGCVVPMADGYAQATGRTAFVNLHTMSGLGNAIGMLTNVRANGTPMVVTAGQQDQALLAADPLLGYDLVAMAAPICKWAREVRSGDELGMLLRRAFLDAVKPPAGPVFLSIPMDVAAGAAPAAPPRSTITGPGVAAGMTELASRLAAARNPAIVLGQEAAMPAAMRATDRIARRLGVPVFCAFNTQRAPFPPMHPHAAGDLPGSPLQLRSTLARFDTILFVGGQVFQLFGGTGSACPEGCTLLHLAPDPSQLGRSHQTAFGTYGDIAASLVALETALSGCGRAQPFPAPPPASPATPAPAERLDGLTAARILCDALPADAIVHNEIPSLGPQLRGLFPWSEPGQFYSSKQTIGWAMAAAVGVSLGHDRSRVSLVVVGDGSAAFSLPAFWSAAREDVPVIFALIDNQSYGILENMAAGPDVQRRNVSPAFDLSRPRIDFVSIAQGLGVGGEHVIDGDGLTEAIRRAVAARRPYLLQIHVS